MNNDDVNKNIMKKNISQRHQEEFWISELDFLKLLEKWHNYLKAIKIFLPNKII